LYSFSKRTKGFALVGKDKADMTKTGFTAAAAGGAFTANFTADTAAAVPTSTSKIRIGINHSF